MKFFYLCILMLSQFPLGNCTYSSEDSESEEIQKNSSKKNKSKSTPSMEVELFLDKFGNRKPSLSQNMEKIDQNQIGKFDYPQEKIEIVKDNNYKFKKNTFPPIIHTSLDFEISKKDPKPTEIKIDPFSEKPEKYSPSKNVKLSEIQKNFHSTSTNKLKNLLTNTSLPQTPSSPFKNRNSLTEIGKDTLSDKAKTDSPKLKFKFKSVKKEKKSAPIILKTQVKKDDLLNYVVKKKENSEKLSMFTNQNSLKSSVKIDMEKGESTFLEFSIKEEGMNYLLSSFSEMEMDNDEGFLYTTNYNWGKNEFNERSSNNKSVQNPKRQKTVLSISGGGIRGIIPALELDFLQKEMSTHFGPKIPLWRFYDICGGTSVGGILSLGVAFGLETDELVKIFDTHREKIFPQKKTSYFILDIVSDFVGLVKNVVGRKYSHAPLESLLKDNFGTTTTLKQAKTNIFVTACSTDSIPYFLSSDAYPDVLATHAGRATSAAPTFFEAQKVFLGTSIGTKSLMDGGMWMNNPSPLAAGWAMKKYNIPPSSVNILSLGTGECLTEGEVSSNAGLIEASNFIGALMKSQDRGNDMFMQITYNNYTRINPTLPESIQLDNVSPMAINYLKESALNQKPFVVDYFNKNKNTFRLKLEEGEGIFGL